MPLSHPNNPEHDSSTQEPLNLPATRRRDFLKTILAASVAPAILSSHSFANTSRRKIRLGLIGCGGRGSFLAEHFAAHGGYQFVAAADYFDDRVSKFARDFDIDAKKAFTGLSGYRKMIESGGLDAVIIQSPPYFHPEQAGAAVEAGLHVYLAKPIAVDVPGTRSVEDSGALATQKGLTFLVDFQTRANELFIEAIKRVHRGDLGKFSFGEAIYHASDPFWNVSDILDPDPKNPENILRAWGVDRTLSGDIIVEQNIHTLDVMSWIMNKPPVQATGTRNQKMRTYGNCSDHFSAIYDYGDNVDVSFTSRQFKGFGTEPEGIRNRMFGSKGVLETKYSGDVLIRADKGKGYEGGSTSGLYTHGSRNNIDAFHNAITNGDASNLTVAPSVQSNLVCILGREAAYTGKSVTWEALLKKAKPLKLDLDLKA